jgi:hypothetical protein
VMSKTATSSGSKIFAAGGSLSRSKGYLWVEGWAEPDDAGDLSDRRPHYAAGC